MTEKEQARQTIAELVERFKADPKRHTHNEAAICQAYIQPMMEALGWNFRDLNEVFPQETVHNRKRADYAFSVDKRVSFYLETKKVKENLNDHYKQAINYARLTGVDWAVLSNFRETRIYYAQSKEKDESYLCLAKIEMENYDNEYGFDDLWLIGREKMKENAIETVAVLRGKKYKRHPVTKILFENMVRWRSRLLRNVIRFQGVPQGKGESIAEIRKIDNAVQYLLDRMIFLRSVEDKGVEGTVVLRAIKIQELGEKNIGANGKGQLFKRLFAEFKALHFIYNSNLFPAHVENVLSHIDDNVLADIIDEFYEDTENEIQWNFEIIKADVLGTVYEQYLSYRDADLIAYATDDKRKQKDLIRHLSDEKETKRRSQGIYYTPQYVVRYIVQQTLGDLLKSGRDPHSLKIVDPACGSGAFLIEAFDVLDLWLAKTEPDVPTRERRERILRENIFGIDLDEQAIEVTRLNLMLRAVSERGMLPLLTNIRHGNSLIDSKEVGGDTAFDWETLGKFDVVIGNPPYIPMEEISLEQKDYFKESHQELKRKYDTSIIFLLLGLRKLLKPDGKLGFISSVAWQTGENFNFVRKLVFEKYGVSEIINLPFDVFSDAYVDTGIFIINGQKNNQYKIHQFDKKEQIVSLEKLPFTSVASELVVAPSYKVIYNLFASNFLMNKRQGFVTLGDISYSTQGLSTSGFKLNAERTDLHQTPFMLDGKMDRYDLQVYETGFVDITKNQNLAKFYMLGEKLLIRRIISRGNRMLVAYTKDEMVFNKDVSPFVVRDSFQTKYVLGILNSKLLSYIYTNTSSIAMKDDFRQTTLAELRRLPIPRLNLDDPVQKSQHDAIVRLVEKMLALKAELARLENVLDDKRHQVQADIEYTDKQIDGLVYAVYGLTPEEIAVVEGK